MKKNEMGGARSTYVESIGAYRVVVGDLRKRDHAEDLGVDGRIFKKWNG